MDEISLSQFLATMKRQWRQGEHVASIGPTGRGKTTIVRKVAPIRDYVCVLAIKRYDDTTDKFKKPLVLNGETLPAFKVIKEWPPRYGQRHVVLWCKPDGLGGVAEQATTLYNALNAMYLAGGWCVVIDDANYMTSQLHLGRFLEQFLNQGRSAGISAYVASTRPRKVPVEAWTQCRHVLLFKTGDHYDLERAAEVASMSKRDMLQLNQQLRVHTDESQRASYSDFLYCYEQQPVIVRVK